MATTATLLRRSFGLPKNLPKWKRQFRHIVFDPTVQDAVPKFLARYIERLATSSSIEKRAQTHLSPA